MGIQGLLPFLSAASMPINIKELKDCVALIDVYCWLHRAVYGCSEDLYHKRENTYYVDYCVYKVDSLKKIGIKCILVFDGFNLPSKKHTEEARRRNREKTRERIKQLLEEGNQREASELMKRCIDITPEMARKLIIACRKHNIDYIVAPYEADAQIAYLMKKKIGHFVITEDSDLLLFECDYVLVKLDRYGNGILIRRSKIPDCLGPKSSNFTYEKFRRMCILSGCDYLPNLPGIGLQKAKKFFGVTMCDDMKRALPKVPAYLKMKGLKVDQEYITGFLRAENTFKYQLVFCPIQRKLVPLNPYDDTVDTTDLDYAGKLLDDDLALQWALGNVDMKTKQVIDDYLPEKFSKSPNFKDDSLWSINFQPRDVNPLDIRFGDTRSRFDSASNSISSQNESGYSSQESSQNSSIKRPSSEPMKGAKRFSADQSLLESYRQSTEVQETNNTEVHVVKSRHFFIANQETTIITKSLEEVLEEREKRRKKISFLCSLDTEFQEEESSADDLKNTDSEVSTPSSSLPSSASSSQTSSLSSSISSSPSLSTAIDLAEPILKDTPPPEKKSTMKSIRNSISLLGRFAFKRRPLNQAK